ncbi:YolD-like family protein [Paenibacillus sp. SAF-054]|uniref:YolD-like family protein n=1 Tax=unclassified Paenibacillus TaxID=185978 RepID=UPI003F806E98
MAKKLEGNGLFESSRLMLPEHREAYNRQFLTKDPKPKPVIDEQEWQMIGQALQESFEEHARVDIELFDPYEEKKVSGYVTVINNFLGEIKLRYGDDWDWIKFEDIISAST